VFRVAQVDPVQYELKSAGKLAQHTAASKDDLHNSRSSHVLAPTRPAASRPVNVPLSTVQKARNLSRLTHVKMPFHGGAKGGGHLDHPPR
jgi:hypothetical protein